MSVTTTEASRENSFVTRLKELVAEGDNGALAALRRGLGKLPGSVAEMHRYVLPWLDADERGDQWHEDVFYLVAALFAFWHQGKEGSPANAPPNIGASLSQLRDESLRNLSHIGTTSSASQTSIRFGKTVPRDFHDCLLRVRSKRSHHALKHLLGSSLMPRRARSPTARCFGHLPRSRPRIGLRSSQHLKA